ncbi:hypothetical protein NUU61_002654 [Penicillium alfredii]|uniref:EGF domain-specific O-linked N-acetylglucosamine transferase n=1 Tax=Penicillium alfredii TaxID=1506179 RepID=A0A9W9FSY8_9EURO|nr:uncharacterized protein NUU61_002654 [Penicillium alfredii]KAJ5105307.1 hypothetical protein NUU61_002654 [Penicillium alfredii]
MWSCASWRLRATLIGMIFLVIFWLLSPTSPQNAGSPDLSPDLSTFDSKVQFDLKSQDSVFEHLPDLPAPQEPLDPPDRHTIVPTAVAQPLVASHPPLPQEYTTVAKQVRFCADRFSVRYLENLRDSATEYCTPNSSSPLTCFHSQTAGERVDTMCIGQNAMFSPTKTLFRMDCKLGDLAHPETPVAPPPFGSFHNYWYDTGPEEVLYRYVYVAADPGNSVPSQTPNYTILVKREGVDNLWHCLMEVFSVALTMGVLKMSSRPGDSRPFFTSADKGNTQAILLDDHADGPYIDLWSIFGDKPTVRMHDLPPNTTFENIIVPLAGASNPLWQGDWESLPCEGSALLNAFSHQVIGVYGLGETQPRPGLEINITFIDRAGSRKLLRQTQYLQELQQAYPQAAIKSFDLAALSLKKQLEIIQHTDVLVGVHGAGLTHGIFLPPLSTMVEILPFGVNHKGFRNVASLMGHSYFPIHGAEPSEATVDATSDWHNQDVFLAQDKFMNLMGMVMKSIEIKRKGSSAVF